MKIKLILFPLFFLALSIHSFSQESLIERANSVFKPLPDKITELKGKKITSEKIELGKVLYFDPRLSKSALISCNTCHNIGMGGDDFQETSTGHAWQKGPRNAPTVFNSVFNMAQFWDGRAGDLAEQAKGPIQAAVEMNNTPADVMKNIKSMPEYITLFKRAFPKDKSPATFDNLAVAIESFEATLITPGSRFDKFLKGDEKALSKDEQKGLQIFMDNGCDSCHNDVNLGGNGYYPFGLIEQPSEDILKGDKGRFEITKIEGDEFSFKVPTLRDIELTPPYFHSGKVWQLKNAVSLMATSQLGVALSSEDVDYIVKFLKTTTGKLPDVVYPILPKSTDRTLKPNLN